jgi:hypothetical protein
VPTFPGGMPVFSFGFDRSRNQNPLAGFLIRSKTHRAGYLGRLIVGTHKSIYPIDRAPAEKQSEEQAYHERGSHFSDVVGVKAVHARPQ